MELLIQKLRHRVVRLKRPWQALDAANTKAAEEVSRASTSKEAPSGVVKADEKIHQSTQNARLSKLESLPAEIRRHLLTVLDLTELRGLVHASPVFHQQYLFDRTHILRRSIQATLGAVTVDACAAHVGKARNTEMVEEIFGILVSQQPLLEAMDHNCLEKMAIFYLRCVKPFLDLFIKKNLDLLRQATECAGVVLPSHALEKSSISRTEALRFTRTFYRFQILCQIADNLETEILTASYDHQKARIERFLTFNQPWEAEGLTLCCSFIWDLWETEIDRVKSDLHPDNPRFDDQDRAPTPQGAFDLDSYSRDNYLQGILLEGLPMLRKVMFDAKDQETLVQTMQDNLTFSYILGPRMRNIFDETDQDDRREHRPSDHDRMQAAKAPLLFRGDADVDGPPLAWTILWQETCSSSYGLVFGVQDFEGWGYVFWDAQRIEEVGGRAMLAKLYYALLSPLHEEDPREFQFVGGVERQRWEQDSNST